MDTILDEDGQPLPAECLAAVIVNYGGSANSGLNGRLVQLSGYMGDVGFFEVQLTESCNDGKVKYQPGDTVLCRAEELTPLSDLTRQSMQVWLEQRVEMYSDEVYDLRDTLDKLGIAVTADAVAAWTPHQRGKVEAYIKLATIMGANAAPRPEELR